MRKRVRYSNARKIQVINMMKEAGASLDSVHNATDIPKSTITGWLKIEDELLQRGDGAQGKMKSNYPDPYPSLTKVLLGWVEKVVATKNLPLKVETIRTQARTFRDDMIRDRFRRIDAKERERLETFNASESWAKKWIKYRTPLGNQRVNNSKTRMAQELAQSTATSSNKMKKDEVVYIANIYLDPLDMEPGFGGDFFLACREEGRHRRSCGSLEEAFNVAADKNYRPPNSTHEKDMAEKLQARDPKIVMTLFKCKTAEASTDSTHCNERVPKVAC